MVQELIVILFYLENKKEAFWVVKIMDRSDTISTENIVVERSEKVSSVIKQSGSMAKVKRLYDSHRLFAFCVLVPTFLSILYYGFIASDVFISESQFVVRSSKQQAPNALGLIFGASFSNSLGDSYSVNAFMLSRDALKKLNEQVDLKKVYGDPSIDLTSRFAGFKWEASSEELHHFYQKHVNIHLDSTSGISELKVKAFNPEDASKINELLLQIAEKHVNNLNERARNDMIQFAKNELRAAEAEAKKASLALTEYQNGRSTFVAANFERLTMEKSIGLKQLEARHAALIQANDDSRRQYLYLERIVEPHRPDYAFEPRRIRSIFSVFVLGLISWGILSMILAGVREHHD